MSDPTWLDTLDDKQGELVDKIGAEAKAQGVEPAHAIAMAMAENHLTHTLKPNERGAVGVMQITPVAAKELGYTMDQMTDPDLNIKAGIQYYKKMLDQFQDPMKAHAAYNWGPGNMNKLASGQLKDLPDETADYLDRIEQYTSAFDRSKDQDVTRMPPARFSSSVAPQAQSKAREQEDSGFNPVQGLFTAGGAGLGLTGQSAVETGRAIGAAKNALMGRGAPTAAPVADPAVTPVSDPAVTPVEDSGVEKYARKVLSMTPTDVKAGGIKDAQDAWKARDLVRASRATAAGLGLPADPSPGQRLILPQAAIEAQKAEEAAQATQAARQQAAMDAVRARQATAARVLGPARSVLGPLARVGLSTAGGAASGYDAYNAIRAAERGDTEGSVVNAIGAAGYPTMLALPGPAKLLGAAMSAAPAADSLGHYIARKLADYYLPTGTGPSPSSQWATNLPSVPDDQSSGLPGP